MTYRKDNIETTVSVRYVVHQFARFRQNGAAKIDKTPLVTKTVRLFLNVSQNTLSMNSVDIQVYLCAEYFILEYLVYNR